ncbi:MAG: response regulator [Pseudomonadota bacterium]
MASKEILVVDDEMGIRELLSEILFDEGYTVHLAENAASARAFRQRQAPDLVLLDIWMPDADGVSLLREWVAHGLLTMPVVMMSGHGTIETALEATRIGAVDFLEKPIALQKLLATVQRAIRQGAPLPKAVKPEFVVLESEPSGMAESTATGGFSMDLPLREARDHFETMYFNYHMEKENGNITRVAEKAGLERTHLYRKLKQLGINPGKKQ